MPSEIDVNQANRMWLRLVVIFCLFSTVIACHRWQLRLSTKTTEIQVVKDRPIALKVEAHSALVVDVTTGQILGQKNANEQVNIASQSKMLTAYAVLKAIQAGQLKWSTQVTIPINADLSSQRKDLFSHLDIKAGDHVSVRDLYTAMFTNSANDAAFALSSYLTPAGQSTHDILTKWANELKLSGSAFYNAAGQHNGDAFANKVQSIPDNAANHASAYEVAMMAAADLKLDPNLKKISQEKTLTYTKNSNEVISVATDASQRDTQLNNPYHLAIGGVKTGSTPESGAAFTGYITDQQGHEFLTVINGAGDYEDKVQRFQKTLDMVGQVLDQKQPHSYKKGHQVAGQSTVKSRYGKETRIPVHAAANRTFWTDSSRPIALSTSPAIDGKTVIAKNKTVGWIKPGLDAQYLTGTSSYNKEIPLASTQRQVPANIFVRMIRVLWP